MHHFDFDNHTEYFDRVVELLPRVDRNGEEYAYRVELCDEPIDGTPRVFATIEWVGVGEMFVCVEPTRDGKLTSFELDIQFPDSPAYCGRNKHCVEFCLTPQELAFAFLDASVTMRDDWADLKSDVLYDGIGDEGLADCYDIAAIARAIKIRFRHPVTGEWRCAIDPTVGQERWNELLEEWSVETDYDRAD